MFLPYVITVEIGRKWFSPAVVRVFAVAHMFSDLRVSSVLSGTTGGILITLLPIVGSSTQVKVSIFTEYEIETPAPLTGRTQQITSSYTF